MPDNNQPTQHSFINKFPPYVWIIASIMVMAIIFLLYCKSTDSWGNRGGLVQSEVNEKIKGLMDDSIKKNRVIKQLKSWEDNLKLFDEKLAHDSGTVIKNYQFNPTVADFAFIGDTINENSFNKQFNVILKNSLDVISQITGDYNIFQGTSIEKAKRSRVEFEDYDLEKDEKTNFESIKRDIVSKLADNFYESFGLVQPSINIFETFDETESYLKKDEVGQKLQKDWQSKFRKGLNSWKAAVKNKRDEITDTKENLINEQKEVRNKIQGLIDETTDISSLSRDKVLLGKVLPVFTILILMLFAIPYIYRNVIVKDGVNESNVLLEIFSKGLLLKVFTVFLLTISIVLLAIGNKIQGETIGTLLGGISVYILQNSFGAGAGNNTPKPDPKKDEVAKDGA